VIDGEEGGFVYFFIMKSEVCFLEDLDGEVSFFGGS